MSDEEDLLKEKEKLERVAKTLSTSMRKGSHKFMSGDSDKIYKKKKKERDEALDRIGKINKKLKDED